VTAAGYGGTVVSTHARLVIDGAAFDLSEALHLAGEYEHDLEVAREARRRFPDAPDTVEQEQRRLA
jgi:hypothetical protein